LVACHGVENASKERKKRAAKQAKQAAAAAAAAQSKVSRYIYNRNRNYNHIKKARS
jgi:cytochrome c5